MAKRDEENKLKGAIKKRSQVYNPKTDQYVKRDTETGKFLSVKKTGGKYKSVRTEKKNGG